MLQIIAICSCISAVCLWCGFVSVCCPRIFNRISKFSGRRSRCSRCPDDRSENRRTDAPENLVKETEEKPGAEEMAEPLKTPSKSEDAGFVGTINAKGNSPSSLIRIRGGKENEGTRLITDRESRRSFSVANSAKKNIDVHSEDGDFDREKSSRNTETGVLRQVDNYTSITSTLSALSKTSNETSFTNSEDEERSVKTEAGERRTEAKI